LKPLPTRNPIWRAVWTADSFVSSSLFETWQWLKQLGSGYSSFMYQNFRVTGLPRHVVGLANDGMTLLTIFLFGLLAFALPPFDGTGDVWNRGREYAVTFTDRDGNYIGRRGIRQDDNIPLDQIPPVLVQAVLATEDARFFDHFGVDLIGTARAIVRNARTNSTQGGSSITQQVAKNLFLSPEKTIRRKVNEAFLSVWIEARLTKQEILKLYLDRSYLGGGNYGVEAASQFYFGKSIRDVNLSEAAVIAGLFKAPTNYAPHRNPAAARARSNVVLFRMLDAGFITQGELLQAQRTPSQVVAQRDTSSPDWYLDYAYENTLELLETYDLKNEYVIEVKTTVDARLQAEMQRIINETVDTQGVEGRFTQASAVAMNPDGTVLAIIGGRDYEESQFNRATSAQRQPGSAFKPFVYMAALLNGFEPDQTVVDGPVSIGSWSPRNYSGGYTGATTLSNALARSYNSIPVKLWQAVGRKKIIDTTHLAGVTGELDTYAPMVLGTSELTLLDLSTGYATFAAGGKQAEPYAVLEIRKPNGELLYDRAVNAAEPEQVFPEERVAALNSMMGAVVKEGTGKPADIGFAPQAGKTGTNQGYRDAWYIGFTAHTVVGVWVGNDDFKPMNEVTGGRVPAPMWKRIVEVSDAGLERQDLAGIPIQQVHLAVAVPAIGANVPPPLTQLAGLLQEGESPQNNTTPPPDLVSEADAGVAEDDANDVLKGMLSVFENKKPRLRNGRITTRKAQRLKRTRLANNARAQPRRLRRAGQPRRQTAYAIPKANVGVVRSPRQAQQARRRPGFFDRLFNNNTRPQRRQRRTVFNF
jgi:penicillin-binding protein 1A